MKGIAQPWHGWAGQQLELQQRCACWGCDSLYEQPIISPEQWSQLLLLT